VLCVRARKIVIRYGARNIALTITQTKSQHSNALRLLPFSKSDSVNRAVRASSCTVKLHMQKMPAPDAPVSTHQTLRSDTTRRAACTHLTMTRLFGGYRCNVCHCIPEIGWIYTCTQDTESAPQPTTAMGTSMAENEHAAAIPEKIIRAADQLSVWVVEAIKNGHYTVEQVELLEAQKRRVNDTVAALEQSLHLEHRDVTLDSPPGASTSLPSVETDTLTSVQTVTDDAKTRSTLSVAEQLARVRMDLFPECRWSCCHTCRPMYRDRSWQSLEGVLASNTAEHISTNFGERRVTHINIARNLGLRKPRRIFDCFEDLRTVTSEEDGGVSPGRHVGQTGGEGEEQEGDESSIGFRASVKRAFRGMLMNRRRHSYSSGIRKKSKRRSSKQGVEMEELDGNLWSEMSNQLLRDTAEGQLPGEGGMDDLELKEVEVEEGVAVTEEALDLGTADIIISV